MPSREELLRLYEAKPMGLELLILREGALALEPAMAAAGASTFFEFGCDDGWMLVELESRGHEATGYEPSSRAQVSVRDAIIYPHFDLQLPGIPTGAYDVTMALGSLDRLETQDSAVRALGELFRVARLFVVLGVIEPGRLGATGPLISEALRLGRAISERHRGTARTILFEKFQATEGLPRSSST